MAQLENAGTLLDEQPAVERTADRIKGAEEALPVQQEEDEQLKAFREQRRLDSVRKSYFGCSGMWKVWLL